MSDRRILKAEENKLKVLYNDELLELKKKGASDDDIRDLTKMYKIQLQEVRERYQDDLAKLNDGHGIKIKNATLTRNFPKDPRAIDIADAKLNGFKSGAKTLGKKALGVLPFAGAAYGLASGDPAMAAEEAAGDIPVIGQIYEAIKPSEIDRSSEIMPTREQRGKNMKSMSNNINEYLDSQDEEKYKAKKAALDKMRY